MHSKPKSVQEWEKGKWLDPMELSNGKKVFILKMIKFFMGQREREIKEELLKKIPRRVFLRGKISSTSRLHLREVIGNTNGFNEASSRFKEVINKILK